MKILKYPIIVILVLVIVFFAVGIFVPSFEYESRIEINAPVAKSWEVFTDRDKMDQWMTGLTEMKVIEGKAEEVGSRFELTFIQRGETMILYETLSEYEYQKLYAFDLDSDVLDSHTRITFHPISDNTSEIVSTTLVEPKGIIFRSLFALIRFTFISQSDQQYAKLKALIEKE